ncbi:MAG TPA: diacylglycerol kinase family protein [Gaiellaceae bacterium]|nr:diacylglycerol kinase family protein [Gaiellaceae bacterium]
MPPEHGTGSGASSTTVFLVNPASDGGKTGKRWPEIARLAADRGLTGDALLSERPEHLAELAHEAAAGGARLIVAVGGDGTVNEVVNGIAGVDGVELAIVHRGTGGDFVRTFGIPHKLEEALDVARGSTTREIDLGRATYHSWAGPEATQWFANIASAGMSGAVAKRVNETGKALGGKTSYAWSTVAVFVRWRNVQLTVTVGEEERSGPMYDVIVANGRYLAGGMKITPEAQPDDGLFDVLLIGDVTKRDLMLTLPKIYRGTHLPHPKAELLRGATVSINAPIPLPVELDGEQPGTTPATFEVVPRALRLRVP